jgi:hypothetical protein
MTKRKAKIIKVLLNLKEIILQLKRLLFEIASVAALIWQAWQSFRKR